MEIKMPKKILEYRIWKQTFIEKWCLSKSNLKLSNIISSIENTKPIKLNHGNNLSKEELDSRKKFSNNQNIVIQKTDKINSFVLLDKEFEKLVNPFVSNAAFSYPLKTSKTLRFSDAFRGSRKGALGTDELRVII